MSIFMSFKINFDKFFLHIMNSKFPRSPLVLEGVIFSRNIISIPSNYANLDHKAKSQYIINRNFLMKNHFPLLNLWRKNLTMCWTKHNYTKKKSCVKIVWDKSHNKKEKASFVFLILTRCSAVFKELLIENFFKTFNFL